MVGYQESMCFGSSGWHVHTQQLNQGSNKAAGKATPSIAAGRVVLVGIQKGNVGNMILQKQQHHWCILCSVKLLDVVWCSKLLLSSTGWLAGGVSKAWAKIPLCHLLPHIVELLLWDPIPAHVQWRLAPMCPTFYVTDIIKYLSSAHITSSKQVGSGKAYHANLEKKPGTFCSKFKEDIPFTNVSSAL